MEKSANPLQCPKSADHARRFCSLLGDLTDRRPQRWRMINGVAKHLGVRWDEAEAAAIEAETRGWLTMEGRHSISLTGEGRRSDPMAERKGGGRWLYGLKACACPTGARVRVTVDGRNR